MSGPPPTPLNLRVLRGNPGKRRLRDNLEPPIPPQPPEPPGCLSGYALDEWYRIGPELHRLGLLTALDVGPFAAYCSAVGRWRTASEALAAMPENERLVIDGKPNPLLRIVRGAAAQMVSIGAQFGMSPTTRSRVSVSSNTGSGKFKGLLAGEN